MMKRMVVLAGACVAMMATPAQAAVFAYSWTGTVVGIDVDGWFGTRGMELDGHSYTMTFNIDPTTAVYIEHTEGRAPYQRYEKIRSNTLTINGVTVSQTNGMVDRSSRVPRPGLVVGQQIYALANGTFGRDEPVFMSAMVRKDASLFESLTPLSPFSYTPRAGDEIVSTFRGKTTNLTFRPTSGTAALVPVAETALPEPTTWVMMIGGLGLVGGATRRARRSTGRTMVTA